MTTNTSQSQQRSELDSAAGRPVIVDVYADLDPMGRVRFDHDWRFEGEPGQGNGRIEIPKAHANDPGTPIHFHLRDDSGRKLRFHDDDPIWVQRSECPNEASEDSEIPRDSIKREPKVLKVLDLNKEKCELHYNLRFNSDKGPEQYDPSIRNGGR